VSHLVGTQRPEMTLFPSGSATYVWRIADSGKMSNSPHTRRAWPTTITPLRSTTIDCRKPNCLMFAATLSIASCRDHARVLSRRAPGARPESSTRNSDRSTTSPLLPKKSNFAVARTRPAPRSTLGRTWRFDPLPVNPAAFDFADALGRFFCRQIVEPGNK